MYIQYAGFNNVGASSRVYNFDVIETGATRQFTVQVQSEAFRPASLMLQDGPGICFARLEQELQGETEESRAEAHLMIGERDIREYLQKHYPHKPAWKKKENSSASPAIEPKSRW
ncbi:MAG: hypothetical protein LAP13_06330 [Acidobacteriia bacterium]|nr:hypothetical protein [Terriglobia bacterium]